MQWTIYFVLFNAACFHVRLFNKKQIREISLKLCVAIDRRVYSVLIDLDVKYGSMTFFFNYICACGGLFKNGDVFRRPNNFK